MLGVRCLVRPFAVVALVAVLGVGTSSACGTDTQDAGRQRGTIAPGQQGGDRPGDPAQPPRDGEDLAQFEGIPLHPRSEPVSERHEENGSVARSFETTGASPELVIDFYSRELTGLGWAVVASPERIGEDTYRGRWSKDEHRLIVSATSAPTLRSEDDPSSRPVTQYSLTIEPLDEELRPVAE